MAQIHFKTLFRKVLLGLISEQDPVLTMMEWVAQMMMQIEAEPRFGAEKGKHTKDQKTCFSGARVQPKDSRLGRLYLRKHPPDHLFAHPVGLGLGLGPNPAVDRKSRMPPGKDPCRPL